MKNLLFTFLCLASVGAFAKPIYQITTSDFKKIEALAHKYQSQYYSCDNQSTATTLVRIDRTEILNSTSEIQAFGQVSYYCADSTEMHDDEYCEFRKDKKDNWSIEYCDH